MRWFRFRFRLRTLFILMTVVAIAVYGEERWRTTRMPYLIDQFITLRDNQEFEQAARVAHFTYTLYPNEPCAQQVKCNADFILHMCGAPADFPSPLPRGTVCKYCGNRCAYPLDFEAYVTSGPQFELDVTSQTSPSTAPSPPRSTPPAE